jgi:thiamine biosynthesis protein ThiS
MPMRLTVNGEVREAPDSATLAELLASMGIETGRVAVERNREIAPRSQWTEIALKEGDLLEIVQFVGGG